jgi:hypothetical protein
MKPSIKNIKEALNDNGRWMKPEEGSEWQRFVARVRQVNYDLQTEGVMDHGDSHIKTIQQRLKP